MTNTETWLFSLYNIEFSITQLTRHLEQKVWLFSLHALMKHIKLKSVVFKQQTLCVFASKLKSICVRIRQKVFNTISTSACTSDKITKDLYPPFPIYHLEMNEREFVRVTIMVRPIKYSTHLLCLVFLIAICKKSGQQKWIRQNITQDRWWWKATEEVALSQV